MTEPRYRIRIDHGRSQPSWVALSTARRGAHSTPSRDRAYTATRPTIEATLRSVRAAFNARGMTLTVEEVP